jgi:uncharacterized coiled-coil protein SlyX
MVRLRRLVLASIVAAGVGTAASAEDALKRFQQNQELTRQKIDADVSVAIDEALKIQAKSPERAAELLRAKIVAIQNEPILTTAQKQTLVDKIQRQLRLLDSRDVKTEKATAEAQAKAKQEAEARAKATLEEVQDLKRSLETIKALMEAKRTDQARKEADALYKKYPNNPATIALREQTNLADALQEARAVAGQQREGYLLAMRTVDKAAIPPKDDIEFNKEHFDRIRKIRRASTLTAKEVATLKALDKDMIFSVKDKSFEEVINDLSETLKTPIVVDELAKNELKIDSSTLVSANLKNVTAGTALRKVLQDKGLAFVLKGETIHVTTAEKARDMLVTRVYYVGDLVSGLGPFNAVRSGPVADMRQTQELVDRLMESFLKVDPLSWEKNAGSGHGTISFHWPSMSFIIRQSAEVHAKLSGTMGGVK